VRAEIEANIAQYRIGSIQNIVGPQRNGQVAARRTDADDLACRGWRGESWKTQAGNTSAETFAGTACDSCCAPY